jgi:PleD family two-component response regulator
MNCPSGASREVIRVLVADSNEPQSQRLSSALDRQSGFPVATSLQERSENLRVLGLMRTLRTVHAKHADVGLILLLDTYDRHFGVNAFRAGARLFCRAIQLSRAFCRCISVVLNSACPVRVINAQGEGLLTPREEQVVKSGRRGSWQPRDRPAGRHS